ncbi:DUF2167 domain-containing protein [Chitinophaga varians]|uniref:DUF2167 domain-containing protein n=1 Tax=Chitinophaga varians TaxID=2202339 RepID=UPI00165F5F3F|nr:DUF2167 domain-containing protein [Chitinophaga varians]MBC9915229.1 DUF2167 domain-containing protein [Chitinophaga varians]
MRKAFAYCIFTCIVFISRAFAGVGEEGLDRYDSLGPEDRLHASFTYQEGKVVLNNGVVLSVPEGYRFLNAVQGRTLVERLWGNPQNPGFLGLLLPKPGSRAESNLFGIEISMDESGYLSQPEARQLNYNVLMQKMQQHLVQENNWRSRRGLNTVTDMYWALPPVYHETDNTLHLARMLQLGKNAAVLNYELRILTRTGALCLTAVANTGQLEQLQALMPAMCAHVHLPIGQRYLDFNPHTDRMAAWTEKVLRMGELLEVRHIFQEVLNTWLFVVVSLLMILFIYVMQYIHRRREMPKQLFRVDERLN